MASPRRVPHEALQDLYVIRQCIRSKGWLDSLDDETRAKCAKKVVHAMVIAKTVREITQASRALVDLEMCDIAKLRILLDAPVGDRDREAVSTAKDLRDALTACFAAAQGKIAYREPTPEERAQDP